MWIKCACKIRFIFEKIEYTIKYTKTIFNETYSKSVFLENEPLNDKIFTHIFLLDRRNVDSFSEIQVTIDLQNSDSISQKLVLYFFYHFFIKKITFLHIIRGPYIYKFSARHVCVCVCVCVWVLKKYFTKHLFLANDIFTIWLSNWQLSTKEKGECSCSLSSLLTRWMLIANKSDVKI